MVKKSKNHLIFKMVKTELLKKIGRPSSENGNQLFYDDYELRIDIDQYDHVEFIECIYGPFLEKTEIEINNINPFKTKSSDLIQILSEKNNGKIDQSEEPYCYAFLNSSVGIYRDSCEVDIDEMITEMKNTGEYESNKDWVLNDKEKAQFFWTVGIGKAKYFGQNKW